MYKNFIDNLSQPNKGKFKLAISDSKTIRYVPIEEIIRLEADGNYTYIYKTGPKSYYSAKTLKEYDELLLGSRFLRVHRSHLINIDHIISYDKQGLISMTDGSVVEVSRRKRDFVQETLKS
ncbi:MAG: LytTR family transcriptional regulator [Saprospiraceae bacterium]|nr:LytTR family transcriptional regulator [Saprospiraceae bacterium]